MILDPRKTGTMVVSFTQRFKQFDTLHLDLMRVELRKNDEHGDLQPVKMIESGHFSIFFRVRSVVGLVEPPWIFWIEIVLSGHQNST